MFSTAYQVYLPAVVALGDLMEGNAKLQGSSSVAGISGESLAGLTAQAVGDATALMFNAGNFLVSAACLLSIRVPPPQRQEDREAPARTTTIRAEIAEGARFIAGAVAARPVARRLGTARTLLLDAFGAGLLGLLFPLTGAGLRAAWLVVASVGMPAGLTGGLGTAFGVRVAMWILLAGFALSGTLLLMPATLSDKNLPLAPPGPAAEPTPEPEPAA